MHWEVIFTGAGGLLIQMNLGVATGALITSEAQTVLAYLSAKRVKGFLQLLRNIMILLMKSI